MSEAELIMDFGTVFPQSPITGPVEFTPTVRVVMAIQGIQRLAEMLEKAAAAYAEKMKSGHHPTGTIWSAGEAEKTAS
jgi:hypothetical protein